MIQKRISCQPPIILYSSHLFASPAQFVIRDYYVLPHCLGNFNRIFFKMQQQQQQHYYVLLLCHYYVLIEKFFYGESSNSSGGGKFSKTIRGSIKQKQQQEQNYPKYVNQDHERITISGFIKRHQHRMHHSDQLFPLISVITDAGFQWIYDVYRWMFHHLLQSTTRGWPFRWVLHIFAYLANLRHKQITPVVKGFNQISYSFTSERKLHSNGEELSCAPRLIAFQALTIRFLKFSATYKKQAIASFWESSPIVFFTRTWILPKITWLRLWSLDFPIRKLWIFNATAS